jgi:hypothetical protein
MATPKLFARAEPEFIERVQRTARARGMTLSGFVRFAVEKHLDELDGVRQREIEDAAIRLLRERANRQPAEIAEPELAAVAS